MKVTTEGLKVTVEAESIADAAFIADLLAKKNPEREEPNGKVAGAKASWIRRTCDKCGRRFMNTRGLALHMYKLHGIAGKYTLRNKASRANKKLKEFRNHQPIENIASGFGGVRQIPVIPN